VALAVAEVKEINRLLVEGFKAAKEQRRDEAYQIFCEVVQLDPNNENGWLYRAATTEDLAEAYVCLQRVLSINPDNDKARRGLEKLKTRMEEESEDDDEAPVVPPVSRADTFPPLSAGDSGFPPPPRQNFASSELVSGFGFSPAQPKFAEPEPVQQGFNYEVPTDQSRPSDFPPRPVETVSFNLADDEENQFKFEDFNPPPPQNRNFSMPDQNQAQFHYEPDHNPLTQNRGRNDVPPDDADFFMPPPPVQPSGSTTAERMAEMEQYFMPPNQTVSDNSPFPVVQDEEDYRAGRDAIPGVSAASQRDDFVQSLRSRSEPREKKKNKRAKDVAGAGGAEIFEERTNLNERGRDNRNRWRSILIGVFLSTLFLAVILIFYVIMPRLNENNNQPAVPTDTALLTATAESSLSPLPSITPSLTQSPGTAQTPAGNTTPAANQTPATNPTGGTGNLTPAANLTAQPGGTNPASPVTTAPPALATTVVAPTQPPATLPKAQFYVPRPGDNLTVIAQRFNTSIDAIRSANREPPRQIVADRIIANVAYIIPVGRPDFRGRSAVLASNETPQQLATRYGVQLDAILKLNGYNSPADIKPGDPLLIP
jgi:LysM repeat protein